MPTPVGHSLWSISMYLLFSKRLSKLKDLKCDLGVIFLCIIIGLAADIDFLLVYLTANPYLHRSITHSVTFILLISFLIGLFLKNQQKIARPYSLAFSLISGHIFWDFFTKSDRIPYGTMFFWPFNRNYLQPAFFIFPGFDWLTLEGMLSFDLVRQFLIELIIFLPLAYFSILYNKRKVLSE